MKITIYIILFLLIANGLASSNAGEDKNGGKLMVALLSTVALMVHYYLMTWWGW